MRCNNGEDRRYGGFYLSRCATPRQSPEYTVQTKADGVYKVFSARGVSGSFVLDTEGRALGMVIGGTIGTPKVLPGYEKWGVPLLLILC